MRKLVTLFMGLFMMVSLIPAQQYWNQYLVNEDFNGRVTLPEGWSFLSGTTAVFGRGGGASYPDGLRITGSGSGNRGGEFKFPLTPDSTTIYVDLDLLVTKSAINYRNTFQFYLLGNNSLNVNSSTGTEYADVIAGIYLVGSSGKFHVWNNDVKGPSPVETPDAIVPVLSSGQFPAFRRAGVNAFATDSMNLSTITNVDRIAAEWYNLVFKLNFSTKKIDVTITQKTNPENTQTFTDLDFISKTAVDFGSIGMVNNRASNQGNAANADIDATVDNFKIYQKVLSLGLADVTVMYQDAEGNTIKESRVVSQQEVSLEYKLLESDKESFISNGHYYAFDPAATGSQSVVVAQGGSSIVVKFKKAAATTGSYQWKGYVSEMWNEQDANFTTDNSNQLAYQKGNSVEFSDADAGIKTVVLNNKLEVGEGNVVFNAPGYSVTSSGGFLTGSGSVIVNANTSLGFINNLSGPVKVQNDTLTVTNAQVANKFVVSNGATLKSSVALSAPIEGDGGTFTFIPGVVAYTSTIKNAEKVQYAMSAKGNYIAQSGVPRMNFVLDSLVKVNVYSTTGDTVLFDTHNSYTYNAIHLGDKVFQTRSTNPASNGTTVDRIGELTGTEGAVFVGNKVYRMTYNVGSLDTDATFAGTFKPFTTDAWFNRTDFDLVKVGNGTWTLSGNSPDFFGSVKVLDGTLKVDGILCDMQGEYVYGTTTTTTVLKRIAEIYVADTATLAGSGYLGATSVVVNGTITGNLEIGGSISLKPDQGLGGATTIINVTSAGAEKIKVAGDFNYGGHLRVNVLSLPQPGQFQIFEFGNYTESGLNGFDTIELPSQNWSFNYETGMLTYAGGDDTSVKGIDYSKEIDTIDYFDATGKRVTKHQKGFVFVKVKYTDGTTSSFKTFVKE